jgi:WD40 repeat protein
MTPVRALRVKCSRLFASVTKKKAIIVIASFATAVAISMYSDSDSLRSTATNNKLDTIEEALLTFRSVYGRLPCPADLTLMEKDPHAGMEAANAGSCIGGVPAANFLGARTVAGAVPVKALDLPDAFMYDAQGQKITYAVAPAATRKNGVAILGLAALCGATVKGPSGSDRTKGALYVLVSHGDDGHGGFSNAGARKNNGSSNADQQKNCHCDLNANPTKYDDTFVVLPRSASFDDIVRFKERAQLVTDNDQHNLRHLPAAFPSMIISGRSPSYRAYTTACGGWQQDVDIHPMYGSTITAAGLSPDNQYFWERISTSASLRLYRFQTNRYEILYPNLSIAGAPAGSEYLGIQFSPNMRYAALQIHDPVTATNKVLMTAFEAKTGVFHLLQTANAPVGEYMNGLDFSGDNRYLAATYGNGSVYGVQLWRIDAGDRFVSLGALSGATLEYSDLKFSPNGRYLALMAHSSAGVSIYKIHANDIFTALPSALNFHPGAIRNAQFSTDGQYFTVAKTSSPYFYVYQIDPAMDAFSVLPTPTTLPSNFAMNVGISKDNALVAVSAPNGGNTLTLYSLSGTALTHVPFTYTGAVTHVQFTR